PLSGNRIPQYRGKIRPDRDLRNSSQRSESDGGHGVRLCGYSEGFEVLQGARDAPISFFRRDRDLDAIQLVSERDLTGEAGVLFAIGRTVEQVVFIAADGGQPAQETRIDVNVARGARAAPAAQRRELVEAG